ncbi:MAG: sorbosone dehydrogenase [Alphaproteobacteria bacterium]|nr:sorbosone dehydrogenase [Alphaproteobacteria bacterium]MAS47631.1 sorbosone dehydrogenase [Alphaproteobacteria bacterium]MAX96497.1 sorbosone dehydrogenase [Alphaproteobacteria bacterium]MBN52062.1 sorbosone dehydrogenase [Alphaproteobacteria bacterium]
MARHMAKDRIFPHAIIMAAIICLILPSAALAQSAREAQRPGSVHRITPNDLPAPYASPSVSNSPLKIDRPLRATLAVPEGFEAISFATGLNNPRYLAVGESGDVYVAESRAGRVIVLRDSDGDGRADRKAEIATGLHRPHGLTFHDGDLYIADMRNVWRLPMIDGSPRISRPVAITERGALGPENGHWTRNVVFAPDGEHFYVSIGSAGNIGEEPVPRATIQQFNADGSGQQTFASGLRNPVGIAFYPGSDRLFTVVNERDGLGDGLVPDYLTGVAQDDFYGWPYAYSGSNPQPGFAEKRPDLVAASKIPDLMFEAHSAPIGLTFYTGDQFPDRYQGGAFVTLRGSWNKATPTGYKVVFVPFSGGQPTGSYETFASGWWQSGDQRARVWGRPTGIAVATDGSLLVSDDTGGEIWQIRYTGE